MTSAVKRENPKRSYRALLHQSGGVKFLKVLSDNIMQGPARRSQALLQINLLQANDLTQLLDKFRVNVDESLLQLAAIFHGDVEVMSRLASACPRLLLLQRQGEYEGQTVLHTLVSKQNVAAVSALLQHPCLHEPWVLLNGKAVGPRFDATVMMGELPLSVAALTFNVEMVDVLLERGAKLHAVNTRGDTAFHSLVRFATLYPQKLQEVERMMRELHKRLQSPGATPSPQAEPRSVWLVENKEGLTVLRLAAALAQPSLFKFVLELEGVYCQLDRHDGLFDSLLYDVTEIDPVARRRWRAENSSGSRRQHGVAPIAADGMPSPSHHGLQYPRLAEVGCCPGADTPAPSAFKPEGKTLGDGGGGGRSASVLEIICETGRVEKAFQVLNTFVVKTIVKAKWRHYRLWFIAWAVLHVLLMTLLTIYAVYKARVIGANKLAQQQNAALAASNTTTEASVTRQSSSAAEDFVMVVACLTVPLTVVVVVWEGIRWRRGQPLNLWLIHHNGLYRVELLVFALTLAADTIWYFVEGPDNNFFLILALLVGWWFTSFFLRPLQKFSFFTVMLQKVLLGDMLRFSTIIIIQLLAFSVAMYMTFLSTPAPLPEEFTHMGTTLLTMFKLMLGLGEVEVLYDAAHPWLAITLFILFVLLTYILMLNALIAMMSNTCSLVSENKVSQWELQRLSVVLMMESMLPSERFMYNSGRPMHVARFDLKRKQMIQEVRYFTKVTSVQTSYTDGAAILKRKSMMQTQRFDDIHAVSASVGNMGHIDLLASFTHQQALLGSSEHYMEDTPEDAPHFQRGGGDNPYASFQPRGKDFPSYDSAGKEKGYGHRHELAAIKEQPEGEGLRSEVRVEGQGKGQGEGQNSSSYISVRQSLVQALLAAQFAGQLTRGQQGGSQPPAQPSAHPQQGPHQSIDQQDGYSSDETESSHQPPPPIKSPHTPKAVRLEEVEQLQAPKSASSPRPKRKRHNSERAMRRRVTESYSQQDDKAKSLEFVRVSESETSQEALLPIRIRGAGSEERLQSMMAPLSVTQMLTGRQTKAQPKLPTPDVFTISHKHRSRNSEA